jgi:hypothetical protein
MTYSDDEVLKAARVLLTARLERGPVGEVPDAVSAALGLVTLPQDDAIARGPRSVLTDEEVAKNLAALAQDVQRADLKLGLVRKAFSLFGLA